MTSRGLDRIVVRRRIAAPPEEVFEAWTEPASLADWFTPVGHADAELDVRVGGHFRVTMIGDGREIEHSGEYLAVDRPRRLAFTWQSPYTGRTSSRVTLILEAADGATDLTLVHEDLPSDAGLSHEGGWNQILDRLARRLEGA